VNDLTLTLILSLLRERERERVISSYQFAVNCFQIKDAGRSE